jgi:hypothetical protein
MCWRLGGCGNGQVRDCWSGLWEGGALSLVEMSLCGWGEREVTQGVSIRRRVL